MPSAESLVLGILSLISENVNHSRPLTWRFLSSLFSAMHLIDEVNFLDVGVPRKDV